MPATEREQLERTVEAACRRRDFSVAAMLTIRGYGRELVGFLGALTRDAATADEVFVQLCGDLRKGLPGFRWDSTLRTWCYVLARARSRRGPRRRAARSPRTQLEHVVAELRAESASYLRAEVRRARAEARSELDADDQLLLILRVDLMLQWPEIARVMAGEPIRDGDEVLRRARALRKRFARIKEQLRDRRS